MFSFLMSDEHITQQLLEEMKGPQDELKSCILEVRELIILNSCMPNSDPTLDLLFLHITSLVNRAFPFFNPMAVTVFMSVLRRLNLCSCLSFYSSPFEGFHFFSVYRLMKMSIWMFPKRRKQPEKKPLPRKGKKM